MKYLNLETYLGLPILASKQGADVDKFIVYVHWLMVVLFVGWMAYFVYALLRFRKTKNPKADYVGVRGHASNYIELAVVVVEAVLLIGFAIPLWAKAVDQFPSEKESTLVHITARQFNWLARYPGPDGKFGRSDISLVSADNPLGVDKNDAGAKDDVVVLDSNLQVPVNVPVIADITSMDVIHSFAVKPLRITQDAIPGMKIPIWFTPTRVGNYQINCAQLCGNSHYFMKGAFSVVEPDEFKKWLQAKASAGAAPASYE
jgi:cytochrome c oxidase subunit 2